MNHRDTICSAALYAAPFGAAAQAQNAPAAATSMIGASQIFGLFAGTLFVLAVIAGIAWLLKRFNPSGYGNSGVLRVVAGTAVGQRERVVVVEIGASWLVLGVAAGGVNLLQQMPRAEMPATTGATGATGASAQPTAAFASWLKQVMDKRNAK